MRGNGLGPDAAFLSDGMREIALKSGSKIRCGATDLVLLQEPYPEWVLVHNESPSLLQP